jgi:hypothetical protein
MLARQGEPGYNGNAGISGCRESSRVTWYRTPVLRGGGWNNNPDNARATNRNRNNPDNRNNNIGFRLLRSPTLHRLSGPFSSSITVYGCGGIDGMAQVHPARR